MVKALNRICGSGGLMLVAASLFAQTFDVVSIRPSTSGARTSIRLEPGGRFLVTNWSATTLIGAAFGGNSPNGLLPDFQIVGGPNWMGSDRFDIIAQGDATLSPERLSSAVLAMLQDRFQLKAHRDMRELPVYALVIARGGPKLKSVEAPPSNAPGQSTPEPPPPPGPGGLMPESFRPRPGAVWGGPGAIIASAVPIAQLIDRLTSRLNRPVIDKTGLTGYFDIRLQYTPDGLQPSPNPGAAAPTASDSAAPSVFTALQEQLGLRLDSTRAPVEVVVVDSIQRPTEN
jgi:uncharacterized protein (TIGR03435 family)